jgi:hypothetical protein
MLAAVHGNWAADIRDEVVVLSAWVGVGVSIGKFSDEVKN